MLCPECGTVIGAGPLDLRRALHDAPAAVQPENWLLRLAGRLWRRLRSGALLGSVRFVDRRS